MAQGHQEKQREAVEKAKRRQLIKRYLTGDRSGPVWEIVSDLIVELNTERRAILEEYITTDGDTDWVWLEENLSFQLDESVEVEANTDEEEHAAYIAGFVLATSVIRAEYPKVQPPLWFGAELTDLRNTKTVPKDVAELVRDAFLVGRDQEAIEMLRPIEEGPFIWRLESFLEGPSYHPHSHTRVRVKLPANHAFEVKSYLSDDNYMDKADSLDAAIGACMMRFLESPLQTWVVGVLIPGDRDHDWNGHIIYAIGNNASEIEEIATENS